MCILSHHELSKGKHELQLCEINHLANSKRSIQVITSFLKRKCSDHLVSSCFHQGSYDDARGKQLFHADSFALVTPPKELVDESLSAIEPLNVSDLEPLPHTFEESFTCKTLSYDVMDLLYSPLQVRSLPREWASSDDNNYEGMAISRY